MADVARFRLPLTALIVGVMAFVGGLVVANVVRDDPQATRHGMMTGAAVPAADQEQQYLAEMVAHHREAIAAAKQLARSHRSTLRAFGRHVVGTQSAQVDTMQAWLRHWYDGGPDHVPYQPEMRDLSALSGDQLDRAFLTDMVRHHMMAVMMSRQLLLGGASTHADVRALAEQIIEEQSAEITQMRTWLRSWFGVSAMPGMG